jgi:UV DNA damage endonuclease
MVHQIQLGLCCLNVGLREQKIFCSRKPILKTIEEKGLSELYRRCILNCKDLIKMIEWNHQNNIKVFRISSELFPHYSNPKAPRYSLEFAHELLAEAGRLARKYGQRLTFHPGQYNVVGTPNQNALQNTIRDLDMHAEILDLMGCDQDSVMVVHGGGTYKNKKDTMDRWCKNYLELPDRVRRRLVLENCEKSYNIEDCLEISDRVGIPVVFDIHHHYCYLKYHPEVKIQEPAYYIPKILETWKKRGIKPKFHISEQGSGQIGHHSDYIETIPNCFLEIPSKYQISVDLMIEAKMKERAVMRLYEKYPELIPVKSPIKSSIKSKKIKLKKRPK